MKNPPPDPMTSAQFQFKAGMKQLLVAYQKYEINLMEAEVAAGAPRPIQHHFSFARFFNWVNDLEVERE